MIYDRLPVQSVKLQQSCNIINSLPLLCPFIIPMLLFCCCIIRIFDIWLIRCIDYFVEVWLIDAGNFLSEQCTTRNLLSTFTSSDNCGWVWFNAFHSCSKIVLHACTGVPESSRYTWYPLSAQSVFRVLSVLRPVIWIFSFVSIGFSCWVSLINRL